jgi:hypothetical protein
MKSIPTLDSLTYRCKYCGWLCTKKTVPELTRVKTKTGDYGSNGTPSPTALTVEQYEATTISFVAETSSTPAELNDSAGKFVDKNLRNGQLILVETTSGTNDGTYTLADRAVSRDTLLLDSNGSLTTESAATAGTVTISESIYQPNVTRGCPFCGSMDSK